ncbi:hypothetical protein JR338_05195 [Chloroflexota bacterium]|nr:hypothetical protein JR338_05195 [Chloroflexota bacterium]
MNSSASTAIIRGLLVFLLLSGSGCNKGNVYSPDSGEINTEEVQANEESVNIQEETWDLLWISDSSGWGVAEIYGQFIAEDNGVEVNVIDSWVSNLSAGKILQGLKTQDTHNASLDKLRDTIAEAEVIVIYGNPESSVNPENPGDWLCGQPGGGKCYVNNCDMDTFSQYIADLKEIYEIIFTIREGKPTIIRAIDAINPGLVRSCDSEIRNTCTVCWETYNEAVHQAADEMGVPIANAFDAWNGIDHNEDPVEKGFTQEDNIHPNELGATVIAQLLRELGYDPIVP